MAQLGAAAGGGHQAHALPPLLDTFPAETYPLREIGTGFTAQSVAAGKKANACAATASEMLIESRTIAHSTTSTGSDASASSSSGGGSAEVEDQFTAPDLPLPKGAAKVS